MDKAGPLLKDDTRHDIFRNYKNTAYVMRFSIYQHKISL